MLKQRREATFIDATQIKNSIFALTHEVRIEMFLSQVLSLETSFGAF